MISKNIFGNLPDMHVYDFVTAYHIFLFFYKFECMRNVCINAKMKMLSQGLSFSYMHEYTAFSELFTHKDRSES